MKIAEHLVQDTWDGEEDPSILHKKAYEVDIKRYKNNPHYRKVIMEIIRYMDEHLNSTFEDYPDPKGIAAPNLGFPFAIIGYKKNKQENQFFINPEITWMSPAVAGTQSNCGSLCLKVPVSVSRHLTIDLEYYDLQGELTRKNQIHRHDGSFTLQHEIDQINGITVADKAKHQNDRTT